MFPRLYGLRTVGIALEDFAPGGAVVGKRPGGAVEKKGDAFAVVAIEAVVVQIIAKLRRADWRQFVFREAAPGLARPAKAAPCLAISVAPTGESQNLRFVFNRSVHFCIRGDQWLIQLTAWPPPRVLRRSLVPPAVLPVDSTLPRFQP